MKVTLSKFSQENFNTIKFLHPDVQPLFIEFLCRIAMSGVYIRVTSGKRTSAEQLDEYRKGRPWVSGYDPKKHNVPPVTDVVCPYSWHCHGLAIDVAPLQRVGTILYSLWYGVSPYETINRIARELGITWGYAIWGTDKPHFQYDAGLPLDAIVQGAAIPKPIFKPSVKPVVLQRALARMGVTIPE